MERFRNHFRLQIFLIAVSFSLGACSEFETTHIIPVNRPQVVMTTSDITDQSTLKFTPQSCEIASELLVTEENGTVPNGTETGWTTCDLSANSLTYTLSNTLAGNRQIRIWAKNKKGEVLRKPKEIPVRFAPKVLIGQANEKEAPQFTYGYNNPVQITKVGTKYYVVNAGSNKIMVYNSAPATNFPRPDLILGQKTGTVFGLPSAAANRIDTPYGMASDGTRFVVTDYENHRVLIWNSIPTSSETPADVVLGQTNFTNRQSNGGLGDNSPSVSCSTLSHPFDVAIYGNRIIVSDIVNNRVLIWNTWPTANNQAADVVLGYNNCNESILIQNPNASTLYSPRGVYVDPATGKLVVGDYGNNRVLIWNSFPTTNGQAADLVLGQDTFSGRSANAGGRSATSLDGPRKITSNGTNLVVGDADNNRVLIWNTFPTTNRQPADVVLGQANFSEGTGNRGGAAGLNTLGSLQGVTYVDGDLWIADGGNHRLLKFTGTPSVNGASAVLSVGQTAFSNRDYTFGVSSSHFNRISDFAFQANGSLALTDYGFNRILVHNSIPTTGPGSAHHVVGQDNFTNALRDRGGTGVVANGFYGPGQIHNSGNYTFVIDEQNNRVLGFATGNLNSSSVPTFVVGQPDFNSNGKNVGGPSASTLNTSPRGVTSDGKKLVVADTSNNRVLIWNTIPTTNGQAADVVIGQSDMSSIDANRGGSPAANTLSSPRGLAIVDNKLIVADYGNRRLLIYDPIPTANGASASLVLGQNGFNSNLLVPEGLTNWQKMTPGGVKYNAGHLTVTDFQNNAIYVYKGVPKQNNQEADYVVGSFPSHPGFAEESVSLDYDLFLYFYNGISDGVRIWVPQYYGGRLTAFPIPAVTPETLYTNQSTVRMSIDSCANRSAVLFNESSVPDKTDEKWQKCTTSRRQLIATLSAGDGLKKIKVWYKDEDGFVIPNPHEVKVWKLSQFKQTINLDPAISVTGTGELSFTRVDTNSSRQNILHYFVSESATPPSANHASWQDGSSLPTYNLSSGDGIKTIYLWAKDIFGNISSVPVQSRIHVDTAPPTSINLLLSGFYSSSSEFTARLTMNSCNDVSKVYFSVSSTPPSSSSTWNTCNTANHKFTVSSTEVVEGNHSIYAWAADQAGNISNTPTVMPMNFNTQLVLGQGNATSLAQAATSLTQPFSISSNGTHFAISDSSNGRVLIYNGDPINTPPSVVLGQPNFTTVGRLVSPSVSANTISYPYGSVFVGSKLVVVDYELNRVLIWNSVPTTNNQAPDVILGQRADNTSASNDGGLGCSSLNTPRYVSTDGTRLAVGDSDNNRVLIWNTIPTTNYAPADVVVGQPNCTTNTAGTTATTLKTPYGHAFHGGKFYVADYGNSRIMVYNTIPSSHGASASFALNTSDLNTAGSTSTSISNFKSPRTIFFDSSRMFIVDSSHRVAVFNTIPTANGASANFILGQTNSTNSSTGTSSSRFNTPMDGYSDDSSLWVADSSNGKVKRFSLPLATTYSASANGFLGGFDIAQSPAMLNSRTHTALTGSELTRPTGLLKIGSRLAVVDSGNNRILIWNTVPASNNTPADVVIGQPDATVGTANNGAVPSGGRLKNPQGISSDGTKLFVADTGNHRVLIFNSIPSAHGAAADYAIGQADLTDGGTSGNGGHQLNTPYDVTYDSGRVFISDSGNHRILIFNSVPTVSGATADLVLGQAAFGAGSYNRTNSTTPVANGLYNPRGVSVNGTRLFVADASNDRIVVWNTIPTSNGVTPDFAIGQASLTASSSSHSSTLSSPWVARVLNGKLYVIDRSRHRIWVYNSIPTASGAPFDSLIGQSSTGSSHPNRNGLSGQSLHLPNDILYDSGSFYITDENHRIIKVEIPN